MTSLELLAPAKNLACGMAAIDHGADAVYIGASRFGARSAAGNSIDDIRQLCRYAHPFGAKVYVTVNTILYDDELDGARRLLAELQDIGVDAVLVQDMAILSWRVEGGGWRENTPSADSAAESASEHISLHTPPSSLHENPSTLLTPRLHASTQTDNRTPEKVRWLRDLGFSRVVLARELSVEEIAEIHRQVPDVELEVFVHGALCVSYSGLCYASQYCFGRSANRGECAQFCRMKFSLVDSEGREVERDRYLLSLKDMNQSDHLLELIEAGATSFKIEGRLKDINYVKNVTAAYSEALNRLCAKYPEKYRRASYGQVELKFQPDVRKSFNRGFTHYFLYGRNDDVFSFDTPKAVGEPLTRCVAIEGQSVVVEPGTKIANGDGLCFFNRNKRLIGFRVNRVEGHRVFPFIMPHDLLPGMRLYRNFDKQFADVLEGQSAERFIPIDISVDYDGEDFILRTHPLAPPCREGSGHLANGWQEIRKPYQPELARTHQTENVQRQLSKLGNTIYRAQSVNVLYKKNYFIPSSLLSEWRRELVQTHTNGPDPSPALPQGEGVVTLPQISQVIPTSISGLSTPPPCGEVGRGSSSYLLNIANRRAAQFYAEQGVMDTEPAFELQHRKDVPVMFCRHCLRYAMGWCQLRQAEATTPPKQLFLRLENGTRFRLEFDCKNCQMLVMNL